MAGTPTPFPWVYPYSEEPVAKTFPPSSTPSAFRPTVEIRLAGPRGATPKILALVDSGSEHSYAAPWIPQAIGASPDEASEIAIGIAGATRTVRFANVEARLIAPGGTEDDFYPWHTDVGFFTAWQPPWQVLLGQQGFFDRLCVTMRRPLLAVEEAAIFDTRFPDVAHPHRGR